MSVSRKRPAEPAKANETKFVVGMYCGAAYHDWAFAGVGGCEVVRLYDVERDMCRLAKLFFDRLGGRGDVVRQLEIRAESVGELVTDVESAVPHADQAWVHVNAGRSRRRAPRPVRETTSGFGAQWRIRVRLDGRALAHVPFLRHKEHATRTPVVVRPHGRAVVSEIVVHEPHHRKTACFMNQICS